MPTGTLQAEKLTAISIEQLKVTKVEKDYQGNQGYTKVTLHAVCPGTEFDPDVVRVTEDIPLGKAEFIYRDSEMGPFALGSQFQITLQPIEVERPPALMQGRLLFNDSKGNAVKVALPPPNGPTFGRDAYEAYRVGHPSQNTFPEWDALPIETQMWWEAVSIAPLQ